MYGFFEEAASHAIGQDSCSLFAWTLRRHQFIARGSPFSLRIQTQIDFKFTCIPFPINMMRIRGSCEYPG
jgi:hypothetical protein